MVNERFSPDPSHFPPGKITIDELEYNRLKLHKCSALTHARQHAISWCKIFLKLLVLRETKINVVVMFLFDETLNFVVKYMAFQVRHRFESWNDYLAIAFLFNISELQFA